MKSHGYTVCIGFGSSFVKKISVSDSGGSPFYLTLGVRQPDDSEKADADDDATRIEIFDITADGFDYDACRQALDELNSDSPSLGAMKGYVEDCMGYGGGKVSDSMAAFNHSSQRF